MAHTGVMATNNNKASEYLALANISLLETHLWKDNDHHDHK